MDYQTIQVSFQESVCFLKFDRLEFNNTINDLLIEECSQVLKLCEESIKIVVIEGSPEVFCLGADFQAVHAQVASGEQCEHDSNPLYDLWLKFVNGPYIIISHVRGKVNAGGVGFVAASDIVIADQAATFSLSELLFGLFPACVLPFLIRRIGFQKAHYLTLMTKSIDAEQAQVWGLADVCSTQSESLLRKHLMRLRPLSKAGITRYKCYMNALSDALLQNKSLAVAANQEMFSDSRTLEGIFRYVEKGQFPWEN